MAGRLLGQLAGEWTEEEGRCYRICQVDNVVYWSYEDMPRVRNVFMGYLANNILTGTWADLPGGQILRSGTSIIATGWEGGLRARLEDNNRWIEWVQWFGVATYQAIEEMISPSR